MRTDTVPELDEDIWYEECADCPADGEGFCMTCWDSGLVPHGCIDDSDPVVVTAEAEAE